VHCRKELLVDDTLGSRIRPLNPCVLIDPLHVERIDAAP
jgi:hypothetical protein